ncbi:MAG: tRNA (guanosine(46)-N7)-methyltransferase TrmB [Gammaproteobacteria bacterium]|nr:tRNA (guanosine(46)-N7)-methyltransferase TrmB [Gammaproteobacteria bacterium]
MNPASDNRPVPRAVRSFVKRGGRITAAQQRALDELWPACGIDYSPAPLALAALFGRTAAYTLEIGFGNGEHLLARAVAEPERDFIGVEVHRPGVGHLLLAAHAAGVHNLRVIEHDAVEVLREQIGPAALDEIEILFPDPWPKKRHHKRRLIQEGFVELLASRLVAGGQLHLATDWEPYAQHMLEELGRCPALVNCGGTDGYATPATRAATRFERRGLRLGHAVRDLLFQRG